MESLYLLVPLGVMVVFVAAIVFVAAVGSGQFDDLGAQQGRMPDDED